MGKIVAIGGGEIGRPGYPVETTKIDKEILRLTGKEHPRLLFVPTAMSDSESYFEVIRKHFGKRLGCETDVLHLIRERPSRKEIEEKLLDCDAVYVGGGNTLKMMRVWRKTGFDQMLKRAYKRGTVLSGMSAGSICWFRWGNSDSRKFLNPSAPLIRISGLGLINASHCPHYDVEKYRRRGLKDMMKRTSGVAIALDNFCAIEIVADKYRVISSKPSANAYKAYWRAHKYHEEVIEKVSEFRSLCDLLAK